MIYDRIANADLYRGISPAIDEALDQIKNPGLADLPLGRAECGQGVFYTVMDVQLKPFEETRWEFHRDYIDIQVGFADGEIIDVIPDCALEQAGPYEEERDITFAEDAVHGVPVPLSAGMFLLLFPGDAHRPCIAAGAQKPSRKLVAKVPVK